MSEPESIRERTWRERQQARVNAIAALDRLLVKKQELARVQQNYWDALQAEKDAVQRNVDAWHEPGGGGVSG